MPELPEVETLRQALASKIVGRRVVDVWSFPSVKFSDAELTFGTTIEAVQRRGKYLIMPLDTGNELIAHLGMTGLFRVTATPTDDKFLRASWRLDDKSLLEFSDVRRFGRIAVVAAGNYATLPTLATMGPEPLSDAFNVQDFLRALKSSDRTIKTQLLSQRPVAGVGNIYADEACWVARVRPAARTITKPAAARLHGAIREVLESAIQRNGTTLRDYRMLDGSYGQNQNHLHCYGRFGEPCDDPRRRCEDPRLMGEPQRTARGANGRR